MIAVPTSPGPLRCIGAFLLLLVGLSCRSEPAGLSATVVPAAAARPWTSTFQRRALLLADEIRIEGPKGLLEHVVVGQDPAHFETDLETRPEGLLQVTRVKRGHSVTIRGHLDGLELVATQRITVLARPGDVPVVVRGMGAAYWSTSDESESERGELIELRGDLRR